MKAYAIIDLQFGSTGKGLLAGYLAKRRKPDAVVCAFGPNAGHTFIGADDVKWIHTMIPIGAVSPSVKDIFIGPGAVIDGLRMYDEYMAIRRVNPDVRLTIHPNAVVLNERHILEEEKRAGTRDTGSTRKGTGAALADKVMREPVIAALELMKTPLEPHVVTVDEYNRRMDVVGLLQIEGAQGFSLSHHHGFYPFVTSRDCTIGQLISDCAVPMRTPTRWRGVYANTGIKVYGTCRTYPIRVNNRGGFSGGGYSDQREAVWGEIGVEPELTTVTKLPRRIFTFSQEQIRQAIRMNAVDGVFLNFCNYINDETILSGMLDTILQAGAPVMWQGWGASERDIVEVS